MPEGWIEVDPQSTEYATVLASIPQPERFAYVEEYRGSLFGCEINCITYGDPLGGIMYYYVHYPGCMLIRHPDPPMEA